LSSLAFKWETAFKLNSLKQNPTNVFNYSFLNKIHIITFILAIISILLLILSQGFTLADLVLNFYKVSSKFTANRYAQKIEYSVFSKIGLSLSYICALLGGLIWALTKSKKKIYITLLFSFLPAILVMLYQSSKGMLFIALFLFLGSIYIIKLYQKEIKLLTFANYIKLARYIIIIIPIVIISFMVRGLYKLNSTETIFDILIKKFASYTFGHLYAFSDWFTYYTNGTSVINYNAETFTLGKYTFTTFWRIVDPEMIILQGTFNEFYKYKDVLKTNIYTIYRGLITDFGIIGTLTFIIFTSYFIHLFYYKILCTKKQMFLLGMLPFLLASFYISYIISILTWNVIPFTYFIFIIILYANKLTFIKR